MVRLVIMLSRVRCIEVCVLVWKVIMVVVRLMIIVFRVMIVD